MPILVIISAVLLALFSYRTAGSTASQLLPFPTPTTVVSKFIPPTPTPTPTPRPKPKTTSPAPTSQPWGEIQQVGPHTYQIRVDNDSVMTSRDELLNAINALRARSGAQQLYQDQRLCDYAQYRADYFTQTGGIDEHRGFQHFLENQNGFQTLGFRQVGENSSYGYTLSGVHLVEWVYMKSTNHNNNQLDPKWDRGCAGVSGSATNIIFATSPY